MNQPNMLTPEQVSEMKRRGLVDKYLKEKKGLSDVQIQELKRRDLVDTYLSKPSSTRMPGRGAFSGFAIDYTQDVGAPDMTTVEGALDAASRGLIPEFKLPFSPKPAGIKARLIASMSNNPDRQMEMLNANAVRSVKLPSGRVVVINPDNTISQLEEEDITPSDIADAGGGVLPTIGGIVGGVVGGAMGAPTGIGALGGATAGAGAGASAGQAGNETIMRILGAKTGLGESIENVLSEGLISGGGTLAMGGAGKGLSALAKKGGRAPLTAPFKKDVVDIGIKSRPMFQNEGADLPVTALTHNRLVGMAYGATKNSAGGARQLADEERGAVEGLDRIIKKFTLKVSPGPPLTRYEVGKIDQEAFELAEDVFNAQKNVRFDEISKAIGDQTVFPSKAEAYISQRLKDFELVSETGQVIKKGAIVKALGPSKNNAFGRLINIWQGLRDERFSYDRLKVLRTVVRTTTPGPDEPLSTGVRSIYQGLEAHLTDDLLENAQRIGLSRNDPTLGKKVADTNAWMREGVALFNGPTGKILANKDPEKIMEALFKPNNDTAIHDARKIFNFLGVGDFYMQFLSRQWLEETARKAVVDGELRPNILARKLHEMGDSTLKAMFPNTFREVLDIKDATIALSAGMRRGNINPSGTAPTLSLLRAPGHPLEFLSNVTAGRWSAKGLTSNAGKNFLTTGYNSPTLDMIQKATSSAADRTGAALQKGAPGAELLRQLLSGLNSPSMIKQEQPTQ